MQRERGFRAIYLLLNANISEKSRIKSNFHSLNALETCEIIAFNFNVSLSNIINTSIKHKMFLHDGTILECCHTLIVNNDINSSANFRVVRTMALGNN